MAVSNSFYIKLMLKRAMTINDRATLKLASMEYTYRNHILR